MTGEVVGLFLGVARGEPMQAVAAAEAIEGRGLKGCRHAKKAPHSSKRQVLLMDERHPLAMGFAPGELKENVVIRGIDLEALRLGQRIRIGEAIVELSDVCVPCQKLNQLRPGLLKESWGRRGMLARVIAGGPIAVGDAAELLDVNMDVPAKRYPKLPG